MNPTIDFTLRLVRIALSGQVDKSNKTMLSHAIRVLNGLDNPTEDEKHAALLHDVIEDSECTLTDLVQFGYSPAVVTMVDLLTHDKHRHTYRQYVQNIKDSGNAGAIKIKLSDNADNSDPSRHTALNPIVSSGLLERYAMAREVLHA